MDNLEQATRMLDVFTSVGANRFSVTFLDVFERKSGFFPKRTIQSMRFNLASWMERAATRAVWTKDDAEVTAGENLIVRPISETVTFVQLDDLSAEQLERARPAAFLIHATSPGNHQAWLAVSDYSGESAALSRRVRKALGAGDESATGSTRIAGSTNFKTKYAPNFPIVTIVHAVPGRVMAPDKLEQMGLLSAPEPVKTYSAPRRVSQNAGDHPWPSYDISLMRAKKKEDGSPDRSSADIGWCMTAITGKKSVEQTAGMLEQVSEKAREEVARGDTGYPIVTARKAAQFVERAQGNWRSRA